MITEPEQLRTYECDGLTGRRVVPALVVLPESTEHVQAVVRACTRHGDPVRRPRRRHRALRRRAAGRRRDRDLARAHEPGARGRPRRSQRVVVEPGVTNLDVTRGGRRRRLLLRARPVQPAGVHDRRQRRRELGRRALPQVRLHRQPRLAASTSCSRTASWRELGGRADEPGPGPARRRSSAPRGRSASRPRSRSGSCARPRRCGRCSPASTRPTRPGGAVSAIDRGAGSCPPAIEMMDRLTIEAAEAAVHAGYPEGAARC